METGIKNSTVPTTVEGWDGDKMLQRILHAALIGLGAIFLFAIATPGSRATIIIGTGLLLSGASFISGGFLGFLFGIPRTGQQLANQPGAEDLPGEQAVTRNQYLPNTNLEQISDWLTKILVGVGLTQLGDISLWFNRLSLFYSRYLGDNPAIVSSIIIYFLVCGFMMGFLWSRLYMAGAILRAESEMLIERVVQRVQDTYDEKAQKDARALSVINQILSPEASLPQPDQESLNRIISDASPPVRVTIFNQAQNFRQQYWNRVDEQDKVSRTIPIFRALIACDKEGKFHRNYAQLGYALKDKPMPEYKEAEIALSRAIQIRDQAGQSSGWHLYEFNRAYCRIKINEQSGQKVFSDEAIRNDVAKARQSYRIGKLIESLGLFQPWA